MTTESVEDLRLFVTEEDLNMLWNITYIIAYTIAFVLIMVLFYRVFVPECSRSKYGRQLKNDYWEYYVQKNYTEKKKQKKYD